MKKSELEQFLDTGWHTDATLYYNGRIYWCEGTINPDSNRFEFSVESWEVDVQDDQFFTSKTTSSGELLNYEIVFEIVVDDPSQAKKEFLEARIFEGKTFWEREHELLWLEE